MLIIQGVQVYFPVQHEQSGQNRQNRVYPVFDGENAKRRSVSVTASGGNSNLARLLTALDISRNVWYNAGQPVILGGSFTLAASYQFSRSFNFHGVMDNSLITSRKHGLTLVQWGLLTLAFIAGTCSSFAVREFFPPVQAGVVQVAPASPGAAK